MQKQHGVVGLEILALRVSRKIMDLRHYVPSFLRLRRTYAFLLGADPTPHERTAIFCAREWDWKLRAISACSPSTALGQRLLTRGSRSLTGRSWRSSRGRNRPAEEVLTRC